MNLKHTRRDIIFLLHIIVLLLSLYLIVTISIDTFRGTDFYSPHFLMVQTYICVAFMTIFFLELLLSKHKWRFFRNNIVFLIFSIPYLYIFSQLQLRFRPEAAYLIQYIPLVRGGYALAIVVGWFSFNKATSLFVTYLVTLLATVYFSSLIFYLFEHVVNPGVHDYLDALWWALMDMTTVGSNITPVTPLGRVVAVLVAALGMMMLPLFTVYVSSLISQKRQNVQQGIGTFTEVNQPFKSDSTPQGDRQSAQEPAASDEKEQ